VAFGVRISALPSAVSAAMANGWQQRTFEKDQLSAIIGRCAVIPVALQTARRLLSIGAQSLRLYG